MSEDNKVDAVVNAETEGQPFIHFWSRCVGAGRANEGLRASWLEQLKLSHEMCGFEYVRFHGLFHDDMCVYKERDEQIIYNWQYIDDLFGRILDIGVRPFVELGFCPEELASGDARQFWWKAHVSPPKDYGKWGDLVSAFVKHCIKRYGRQEVCQWYFEIWNEPNLRGFWDGTRSQYFELYKVSALTIKAIDEQLRVGGPSTSNFVGDERFDDEREDKTKHLTNTVEELDTLQWKGVWIEAFLEYCKNEKLPVDFITTHPYPTDFALNPGTDRNWGRTRQVNSTRIDIQWLNDMLAKSAFPDAEIHLTEWSSSPSSRDFSHDFLPAAAFIVKINLDCIGMTDSLSYWTFTDVFEEVAGGDTIFHGGFGMINYQGIVKPSFHAYRMLHMLGDEILHKEEGMVITRDLKTQKIIALLYHYPDEMKSAVPFGSVEVAQQALATGTPKIFSLVLENLSSNAEFSVETLDKENGFAYLKWQAMGSPEPPTPEQTEALKQFSMTTSINSMKADSEGVLSYEQLLDPWTVVLIQEK